MADVPFVLGDEVRHRDDEWVGVVRGIARNKTRVSDPGRLIYLVQTAPLGLVWVSADMLRQAPAEPLLPEGYTGDPVGRMPQRLQIVDGEIVPDSPV